MRCCATARSGPLEGFRSKLGRPFAAALKLTDANEVTFDFGEAPTTRTRRRPDFTGQEPLGPCPKCGANVFETPQAYVCEKAVGPDKTCDFRSGRVILQRPVERAQMQKLLATGKTDLLQFVSARTRRPFSAFLVRQPDGKIGFEFEARDPTKAGGRARRARRTRRAARARRASEGRQARRDLRGTLRPVREARRRERDAARSRARRRADARRSARAARPRRPGRTRRRRSRAHRRRRPRRRRRRSRSAVTSPSVKTGRSKLAPPKSKAAPKSAKPRPKPAAPKTTSTDREEEEIAARLKAARASAVLPRWRAGAETDALRERQLAARVDRVRLAPHVRLPRVAVRTRARRRFPSRRRTRRRSPRPTCRGSRWRCRSRCRSPATNASAARMSCVKIADDSPCGTPLLSAIASPACRRRSRRGSARTSRAGPRGHSLRALATIVGSTQKPGAGADLSAADDLAARRDGLGDRAAEILHRRRIDQRSHQRAGIQRVADLHLRVRRLEALP